MIKRIPIIPDTDPGHDDAFALMMALASDKLELKAVTTVAGNSNIENTTLNALRILERVHRTDIPVAKGLGKPLAKELIYDVARKYHGDSGLDGPDFAEVTTPLHELDAVDLIAKIVRENKEKITLVPVGPLTNIALFILCYPELVAKIEQIVIMGGLTYPNPNSATEVSEYNVFQDPEAADIVFKSGVPLVMHSINSTGLGRVSDEQLEHMRTLGNAGRFAAELLDFYKLNFIALGLYYYNICDSHAIAWLIDPTIYTGKEAWVELDLNGEYTRAMTICDLRKDGNEKKNCFVVEDCDEERYFRLMFECLEALN